MNKKILFTTSHPAPYWDIIYNQVAEKSEITVYYNRSKDVDKAWKKQNNVQGKLVSETDFFEKLRDIKKCDFAVLGGWGQKSNLLFMFMLLILKKQFAFFSDVPDAGSITPLKRRLKKSFFKMVPFLYVTGSTSKNHYQKYYNISDEKIVIFPYGVNLPNIDRVSTICSIRECELRNNSLINIFIANRFLERKGYKTLLRAFTLLKEKSLLSNFSITIAGQGEQFDQYRKKLTSLDQRIRLVGWVELDEYENFLKEADIYIHASYFEPYGIPVIDAMANGKSVIASDGVMSAIDNIKSGENGFIYSKFNANELSDILEYMINDQKIISRIGQKALEIHKNFRTDYFHIISNSIKKNKDQ